MTTIELSYAAGDATPNCCTLHHLDPAAVAAASDIWVEHTQPGRNPTWDATVPALLIRWQDGSETYCVGLDVSMCETGEVAARSYPLPASRGGLMLALRLAGHRRDDLPEIGEIAATPPVALYGDHVLRMTRRGHGADARA